MSRKLATLLSNTHPLFVYNVQEMERASGAAGIDVRLIADVTTKAHDVMRQLGLDTADTSAVELYQVLNSVVQRGDDSLLRDTTDTLLVLDGEVVSFNLLDVIENAHHQLPFAMRNMGHAQRRLRAEIIKRYAEHDRTSGDMVQHLAKQASLANGTEDDYVYIDKQLQGDFMNESASTPSILAIGDIFTDAFITLGDETAKIIKEGDEEWLAVPFGRKPPYERVDIVKSVGPSPNVAVSIARLGYSASLMAWVGDDATGEEGIEYLKTENVDVTPMITEAGKATSYWYVLCYKADRTMLVKSEKYKYEWRDPATKPGWIYLAYLGEDSWPLHEGLIDYLERNPDVKFALQPGTFQFKWGLEKMAPLYKRSDVVLMNREEAMEVTGLPHESIKDLANGLHELGPEIAVITDGPNGSFVSENGRLLTIPNYPDPVPPLERTGAGDAFSSTFVAAVAAGESVETALSWAPINSMSVVQQVGAQRGLLTRDELLKFLEDAPDFYKVSEV